MLRVDPSKELSWYDMLAQMVTEHWGAERVINWVADFAKGFTSFDELETEVEIYYG